MLPGPINYLAAIIGSVLYVVLVDTLHVGGTTAEVAAIGTVFAIRMLALRYGIKAPEPVDIAQRLPAAGRRRPRRSKPRADT